MSTAHQVVIAWRPEPDLDPGHPWVRLDTGLGGSIIDGAFVIPFANHENAVDCLRIVLKSLRDAGDEPEAEIA